jgi:protein disulfide-isomerase
MRKILILLFTLFAAGAVNAAEWLTDYNAATKLAQKENKPILVDFEGSDWCVWCTKLDKEVFDTPEFTAWATKNVVLLKLDFPRANTQTEAEKEMNAALAAKYRVEGFPTILILDKNGEERARTGYKKGGVKPYLRELDGLLSE